MSANLEPICLARSLLLKPNIHYINNIGPVMEQEAIAFVLLDLTILVPVVSMVCDARIALLELIVLDIMLLRNVNIYIVHIYGL